MDSNEYISFTFFILKKYKTNIVNYFLSLLKRRYNFREKSFFQDIFIHWYFQSVNENQLNEFYLPRKLIVNKRDVTYFCDKYNGGKQIIWSNETLNEIKNRYFNIIKNYRSGLSVVRIKLHTNNFIKFDTYLFKRRIGQPRTEELVKSLIIRKSQFSRCKRLYTHKHFIRDFYTLVNLYDFLGTKNMHLGVPKELLISLKFDGELFGTPLNTTLNDFCSPFPMETKFGSMGSFFDWSPPPKGGKFTVNPPYIETLLNNMAKRLIYHLTKTKNLEFIITLPDWGESLLYYITLKNSKFFQSFCLLDRLKIKFYDHFTDKFVPIVNCHLFVLSNKKKIRFTAMDIEECWKKDLD